MIENMSFLHDLVLQHHEVHQDVADGRHGVLGVDHLKLGVVYDVEWFCNICVILSLSLNIKESKQSIIIIIDNIHLFIKPLLVTIKDCPMI